MKNWFKKKQRDNNTDVESPKVILKGKNMSQIIEEIHETFFSEVDKLLASAKISKSLDTDKQELIDKCNRLKALGFTNTKEVTEAESEIKRLEDLKKENELKKELIEAINYFSFKYPQYKFITEGSVKKICEKYNLIYGETSRYIGTVPDKNLKQIEEFKIQKEDDCYLSMNEYNIYSTTLIAYDKKYITNVEFNAAGGVTLIRVRNNRYEFKTLRKCPLEIAAPLKDFNMTKAEIKDFKISDIIIFDPVVLKPVIFNSKKYYLIVSAWGNEASDELVVNQKMN